MDTEKNGAESRNKAPYGTFDGDKSSDVIDKKSAAIDKKRAAIDLLDDEDDVDACQTTPFTNTSKLPKLDDLHNLPRQHWYLGTLCLQNEPLFCETIYSIFVTLHTLLQEEVLW